MAVTQFPFQTETEAPGREAVFTPGPKPCVHMLSGEVSYKQCTWRYDCVHCPYDLMLEEARWPEQNRSANRIEH